MKDFRIEPLDSFTCICGHFNSETPEVNNGYNCDHPNVESYEMIENKKIGKCYAFGCPLAPEADKEDLKNWDIELLKDYEDDEEVHDYMVVSNEDFPEKVTLIESGQQSISEEIIQAFEKSEDYIGEGTYFVYSEKDNGYVNINTRSVHSDITGRYHAFVNGYIISLNKSQAKIKELKKDRDSEIDRLMDQGDSLFIKNKDLQCQITDQHDRYVEKIKEFSSEYREIDNINTDLRIKIQKLEKQLKE